jgi:hypothetical protein
MSLTAFVGILILSSFLIRNYYLSGYLIYPFPSVDIFNVDWKIPFGNALSEKFEIESWAKIPAVPPSEVIHMKISEWFLPWMRSMNFLKKLLIAGNLLSIFSIVFMVLRKDYFFLKIQLIVLLNLAFWFLSAPDPRFSMGSLFIGFSLNVAYITSLFETESSYRIVRIFLAGFLIMIFCRRITFPLNTLSHPARWVIPPAMETTLTNEYFTGFHYRVPVEGDQCFNVEIPCVPYELNDVELRGKDISDGFKIKKKI